MYYDGRFKLSVYHGIQFGELYDMENDPQEQHNLWYDGDHQDVKQALILDSFGVSTKYLRARGRPGGAPLLTPHLRQNKRAEVNNGDRILYQATIRC